MKRILAALVFAVTVVRPAYAHSPFPGVGAFYNGMLHPLIVPEYTLALLSLGLLFGQKAPRSSRIALPAFAIALIVALATPASLAAAQPPTILLGIVLLAGLVVAFSVDIGAVVPGAVGAVVGILIGLDARQNAIVEGQSWVTLAGMWLGAVIIVALVAGFAMWLSRRWHGIAVRVLGSWTAASAFLVIGLSFASTAGKG